MIARFANFIKREINILRSSDSIETALRESWKRRVVYVTILVLANYIPYEIRQTRKTGKNLYEIYTNPAPTEISWGDVPKCDPELSDLCDINIATETSSQ